MKHIFSLSILMLLFGNVSRCQTDSSIQQIELTKISRGYQEYVRVNSDSLHVLIENRRGDKLNVSYSRKVTTEEWSNLINATKDLVLNDLPSLPSPTMKRASDGAMHATITIYTKDKKSFAHGYDDEDPHKALQPLRKAIRELSDRGK